MPAAPLDFGLRARCLAGLCLLSVPGCLLRSAWSNKDKHMLGRLLAEYQGPCSWAAGAPLCSENAAASCRMWRSHPRGCSNTYWDTGGHWYQSECNNRFKWHLVAKNTSWHCFSVMASLVAQMAGQKIQGDCWRWPRRCCDGRKGFE